MGFFPELSEFVLGFSGLGFVGIGSWKLEGPRGLSLNVYELVGFRV